MPRPPRAVLLLAALILLCAGTGAQAQVPGIVVTTSPATPMPGQPVTIIVFSECTCPGHFPEIVRTGFVFDIAHSTGCLAACIEDQTVRYEVGALERGIYTVRHFPRGNPAAPTVIGTFAVREAVVPTLGFPSLAALSVVLALISIVALRR